MLVEMKDIVVDFGPVRAVDHVSVTINPGEIVGLLGENGAGKSTLMNALGGTLQPQSGTIMLDGEPVKVLNARVAGEMGIRFVHQELNLCSDLKVYEYMFLAEELRNRAGFLKKKEMIDRALAAFERMHVSIDPESLVGTLRAAEKQLVECAKAILFSCELIIMDEPSTALSTGEIDQLFAIMRELRAQGVAFIYISHKMPELFEICDRYYVMRDGKRVAEGRFADIDENGITELMIGRQLAHEDFDDHIDSARDEIVMTARSLSGDGFKDISFDLRAGEILAVTGLQGSGRDHLADALFGERRFEGELTVNGRELRSGTSILSFMRRGVAMVPRMRNERGIHNDLTIYDNFNMAYLTERANPWVTRADIAKRYEPHHAALSVRSDNPLNPITSLSGGNQQKVILAKWLETDADILIFDNPTQGIDVGTKFEIYHLILDLARRGKAIIVFSAEHAEIRKVADSCLVMFKGEIATVLSHDQITERNVMFYSTGADKQGDPDATISA